MIATAIDNTEDFIDSRDVIEHIEELEGLLPKTAHEVLPGSWDELNETREELRVLKALQSEAEGCGDWPDGATLIRDTYFQEYAEQLAEDVGAISVDVSWPLTYIDWPAAADALKQDYTEVDFDGVAYWVR